MSTVKGKWTPEELQKLLQQISQYQTKFSSYRIPGRSTDSIRSKVKSSKMQ